MQSCVALGGTYAVFTSKHEDGMMNFPTNATNYTIETSPFCQARRAAGRTCDLVAEFLASCDKYNVTRGLYYTAFNNHCKATNTSQGECNTMLRAAFTDVATRYGKIDQFWFDHGNGLFIDLIDKYQPEASILGREWTLVGTEGGYVLEGAPFLCSVGTDPLCLRLAFSVWASRTWWYDSRLSYHSSHRIFAPLCFHPDF